MGNKKANIGKIILSRTDNIGDVMLALPMAGIIKSAFPEATVAFLGKSYTRPLIKRSIFIDEFLNWDELGHKGLNQTSASAIVHVFPKKDIAKAAKAAGIPLRIGTSHRLFHWWTCNHRVNLGRKNSSLHEAQLNLKLLAPLGITKTYPLKALPPYYGWSQKRLSMEVFRKWLKPDRFNLIFHMKSKGSAREWPVEKYAALAKGLAPEQFHILLSGTTEEGVRFREEHPPLLNLPHVTDISGQFDLNTFIDFIQHADGLLACSTGPLHIAAASGIHTLGLYPDERPMHAGRWGPLGENASWFEAQQGKDEHLLDISVDEVKKILSQWYQKGAR